MTITVLKPKIIKPERIATPQCCVPVDPPTHNPVWRRDRYTRIRPDFDPGKCQRESVVEIEGKHYCRLHAGCVALDMWISGKLVHRA